MTARTHAVAMACAALLGCLASSPFAAQEKPLDRAFIAGSTFRYRVRLTVRSELEGQKLETVGQQTFATPFHRFAEASVSWVATQHTESLAEGGSAEMEEGLGAFSPVEVRASDKDDETMRLREALRAALQQWSEPRQLRYREDSTGSVGGVGPGGAPALDEASPQLLTPWLERALRPAVALPPRPIRLGERWQEPRQVQLPNWTHLRGSESGAWLEAPGTLGPAVQLHVVQQIFGTVAGGADKPAAGGTAAEGRFHGESLSTISLADGRLLAATRSATREISWVLDPVEGLPEPPRFRGRLSVQVSIEEVQ